MATRRPRVPKTSQRQLADVGAGATHRTGAFGSGYDAGPSGESGATPHLVGGHSAKVIPFDAAPSRHAPAPVDAELPAADNVTTTDPDREPTLEPGAEPTPEPTPEQRRADERRDLLHRSAPRGQRRSPGQPAARPTPNSQLPVEPVPARNFTGRSVAFLVVLFVAAVLLAPTLRVFLDQQSELRAVQEDIATEQQLQQDLTDEIARWDDPAYIQQQARERFNLVMPGEQTYMVIGGEDAVEDPVPEPASPSEVNQDMPWADALWDSVVRAGTD